MDHENTKNTSKEINPTMDGDYLSTAACTDCTGLIPSVTSTEDELESYEELYPYLPPVPPPSISDHLKPSSETPKILTDAMKGLK